MIPNEPAALDYDEDYCPRTRDELEQIYVQSNFGNDQKLFLRYFLPEVSPVCCNECGGLITQHNYSDPSRRLPGVVGVGRREIIQTLSAADSSSAAVVQQVVDPFHESLARRARAAATGGDGGGSGNLAVVRRSIGSSVVNLRASPDDQDKFQRGTTVDTLRVIRHKTLAILAALALIAAILMLVGFLVSGIINGDTQIAVIGPVLLFVIAIALSFVPSRRTIQFDRETKEIRFIDQRLLCFCLAREDVVPFGAVTGILIDPAPPLQAMVVPAVTVDDGGNKDSGNDWYYSSASSHDFLLCFSGTRDTPKEAGSLLLESVDVAPSAVAFQERWWLTYFREELGIGILSQPTATTMAANGTAEQQQQQQLKTNSQKSRALEQLASASSSSRYSGGWK